MRKRKAAECYAQNVKKKAKHAAKRDHAETILSTSLITNIPDLETQLLARSTNAGARIAFLKDQFHAHMSGKNPLVYPGIGAAFRGKFRKLKLTPADAKANKEEHLTALIKSMIAEDEGLPGTNNTRPNYTENFIRVLPSLSEAYMTPVSCDLKAEFAKHIAEIAAPKDDPVYVCRACWKVRW